MDRLVQTAVLVAIWIASLHSCACSQREQAARPSVQPPPAGETNAPADDLSGAIDGTYEVRWSANGDVSGTLSLSHGAYRYEGLPAPSSWLRFHFAANPRGRYTVRLAPIARGARPESLSNDEVVATINFDPATVSFDSTESRKLVLVRWNADRQVLYFHSVVNELETWRIERSSRGTGGSAPTDGSGRAAALRMALPS